MKNKLQNTGTNPGGSAKSEQGRSSSRGTKVVGVETGRKRRGQIQEKLR